MSTKRARPKHKAVALHVDGTCHPVTVQCDDAGRWNWTQARRTSELHVHNDLRASHGLVLLSPTPCDQPFDAIFSLPLPPPLNLYVYPEGLIAAACNATSHEPTDLSPGGFAALCETLINSAQKAEAVQTAVYDVPAIPILNVDDDWLCEDEEEGEEEEYESGADSDMIDDEDEPWEDDTASQVGAA